VPQYLEALKAAPKAVKEFIDGILDAIKKQKRALYEPICTQKSTQERGNAQKIEIMKVGTHNETAFHRQRTHPLHFAGR
jgi:hypothetical protein